MRHFRYGALALAAVAVTTLTPSLARVSAQSDEGKAALKNPHVVVADAVGTSVNLRDITPLRPATGEFDAEPRRTVRNPRVRPELGDSFVSAGLRESAVQTNQPATSMPAPLFTWDGATVTDCNCAPPDTNGDVGPNHYVQQVNVRMRVYNKTTGALLAGPVQLSQLFVSAGLTDLCATTDEGDPVVLYDQLADRWLISQFAITTGAGVASRECVAVSRTPDPTGQWYVYSFASPDPGSYFQDYPHLGVWPDGYYMTTNEFNTAGTAFVGGGAFAFEREKMLAGLPGARILYFDLNLTNFPEAIGGMLPSDLDGYTPPPAGAPNAFVYPTAVDFGDPANGLRIFNFHADWANTANSTFAEFGTTYAAPLPVAPFNAQTPAGRADVEQPVVATSSYLDAIADRLMHRLQYRNFGPYQTLVANHTVNVGPGATTTTFQAGVRWYDLRKTGGFWSIHDQGTYAPADASGDATPQRWMASAAMDASGNLAIGYSKSSTTLNPSIYYAGRLAADPAGQLAQGENALFTGLGAQSGTSSRWGDYSGLVLDVDDCTYYYTTEYYPAGQTSFNWRTRIGRFNFGAGACTPPALGSAVISVSNCSSATPIAGAAIYIGGTLYGTANAAGVFNVNLPPGTYTVEARYPGLGSVSGQLVVAVGGQGTLNLCMVGVPVIGATASALSVESCPPANGAVDPNERVTYSLTLTNTGTSPSTNLVATLQAGANVSAPTAAQSYGVVAPGASATRTFSWTAVGTCGQPWTASFALTDGALTFPNATITGTYGAIVTTSAFSENFDGVTAPALPAGWTAVNATGTDGILWVTSTTTPDTAPNDAFVNDPSTVHDKRLDSATINLPATGTFQLKFKHRWALETGFDGGVLEISINGGAFADIVTAGGSFASGGYNGTISTNFSSPIAGRQAWTGSFNTAYTQTVVNLPAAAAGQAIKLRFRMGSDSSVTGTGWRVDTIAIESSERVCSQNCATVRLVGNTVLSRIGPNVQAVVTVTNTGSTTASNVSLTTAMLGATAGGPVPQALGNIPAGGSASATVMVPAVAVGPNTLRVGGTYTGGIFSATTRVTVP